MAEVEINRDDEYQPLIFDLRQFDSALDAYKKVDDFIPVEIGFDEDERERKTKVAVFVSLIGNITLLIAKIIAILLVWSRAILASTLDSFLDLLSSILVIAMGYLIQQKNPDIYPLGKTRFEPLGILVFAVIMGMANLQVVLESSQFMIKHLTRHEQPVIESNIIVDIILAGTVILKTICWLICKPLAKHSASIDALATDHLNDVQANLVAFLSALLASRFEKFWWVDPAGAIIICLYIISMWVRRMMTYMTKLAGRSADPLFVQEVERICANHPFFPLEALREREKILRTLHDEYAINHTELGSFVIARPEQETAALLPSRFTVEERYPFFSVKKPVIPLHQASPLTRSASEQRLRSIPASIPASLAPQRSQPVIPASTTAASVSQSSPSSPLLTSVAVQSFEMPAAPTHFPQSPLAANRPTEFPNFDSEPHEDTSTFAPNIKVDIPDDKDAKEYLRNRLRELESIIRAKPEIDRLTVYHYGSNYLVEVEILLPGVCSLKDQYDCALALQQKLERMSRVDRSFVHVDYKVREEPEHKMPE